MFEPQTQLITLIRRKAWLLQEIQSRPVVLASSLELPLPILVVIAIAGHVCKRAGDLSFDGNEMNRATRDHVSLFSQRPMTTRILWHASAAARMQLAESGLSQVSDGLPALTLRLCPYDVSRQVLPLEF